MKPSEPRRQAIRDTLDAARAAFLRGDAGLASHFLDCTAALACAFGDSSLVDLVRRSRELVMRAA